MKRRIISAVEPMTRALSGGHHLVLCFSALAVLISPRHAAAQSFVDISSQVKITQSGLVLDRATNTFNSTATVTNSSAAVINGPLVLIVSAITPNTVTLANTAGQVPSGAPYVNLSAPTSGLAPGASISNALLEFNDPSRAGFTFTLSVAEITTSTQPGNTIFGPKQYAGTAGTPLPVTDTFQNCEPAATYEIIVANGNSNGTNRVNSATILLNGTQAVGPADLNQAIASVTRSITVIPSDTLLTTVGSPAGGFITTSIQCVSNCLSVQITSPTAGSSESLSVINVGGTVTSSADEIGVTINGVVALSQGGQFQAPNVPLTLGSNTLTATATNACGNQAVASISINAPSVNTPAISITATPTSGLAPLAVTFTATVTSSNPIAQYQWDFNGNGTVNSSDTTSPQVTNTYTSAGLFIVNLTTIDTQGSRLSAQVPILVMSPAQLNTLIQTRWSSFTTALANNNPTSALAFMLPGASAEFQTVFNKLAGQLPSIAASLGNVALSAASGGLAEFITIRHQATGDFVYFIELVQDQNGLWKIESM